MMIPTARTQDSKRAGRAHLATVVASAVAAALVGIGTGTGQRASSSAIESAITGVPARASTPAPTAAFVRASTTLSTDGSATPIAPGRASPDVGFYRDLLDILDPSIFARSGFDDCPALESDSPEMAFYNGRPVRVCGTRLMKVTAYSPDFRSCGASADGITASGYSVLTNGGCMVAADPSVLPLGSIISVPGYDGGSVVPVLDTGGAIKGDRLDVLYSTHEVAMQWGVQEVEVKIWQYADGLPNGFRRLRRRPN
jgi:3D (Asp-Asp-Asp) domain-containing protein